jgi:sugar phosphate isomerase/epimerase
MIKYVELRDVAVANLTVGGGAAPVELIEAAAAAGLGKIGLLLHSPTSKPLTHEIAGRPEVIREIKAACSANGVGMFDVEAFLMSPSTDLNACRTLLATGAELGATHISAIGAELLNNSGTFFSTQQCIDFFGALCEAAQEYGLHVGVEFMKYRDVSTLDDALALLNAVNRPNAGVIFDVLHFHRTGGRPEQLDAVPPERIAYVQLCDAVKDSPPLEGLPVEARTSRLHLGDGVIPLDALLDRLPEHAPVAIETPVKADAELSIREKIKRSADATRRFFEHRK